MNLDKIEKLLSKQNFPVIEKKPEFVKQTQDILLSLGVKKKSEFYELYSKFFLTALNCRSGTSIVVDILDDFSAEYYHDIWKIPKNYIAFTSGSYENGYLYNIEDNTVWDFTIGKNEELLNGTLPHWNSFYEFMEWYLDTSEGED